MAQSDGREPLKRMTEDVVWASGLLARRLPSFRHDEVRGGGWTASEHALHVILHFEYLTRALADPDRSAPSAQEATIDRWLLFTTWRIPGDWETPEPLRPAAILAPHELAARLASATRELVDALFRTPPGRCVAHHRLGMLDCAEWCRYLVIHGHHHDRVIRRLLSESSGRGERRP